MPLLRRPGQQVHRAEVEKYEANLTPLVKTADTGIVGFVRHSIPFLG